jgi:hypothetical protein
MQKVVEFKSVSFWSGVPKLSELNIKIESLNRDGWKVVTIVSNTSFAGYIRSYSLLVEK